MTKFSVDGDGDNWLMLDRVSKRDWPLVVRTRDNAELLTAASKIPLQVVKCVMGDTELVGHGMLTPDASNRLYDYEDSLIEHLVDADFSAFQLAIITGEGRRDFYFSTSDEAEFRRLAAEVAKECRLAPNFEEIELADCLALIRPTELEKQLNGDRSVIDNLRKHGDNGLIARKTEFWFYGQRPDLEVLCTDLGIDKFVFECWLEEKDGHENLGVVISREMTTDYSTFETLTPVLLESARKNSVVYDGWETLVLKDDHELTASNAPTKQRSVFDRLFGKK